ncbi:transglycosylase SLT domain-containing protein [Kangiella sp.]|uniref:transglycosylase SLT domain-containing protein n=1 Tax=Kangiella sp. TaxID=1920245 RepID=UPI003A8D0261
MTMRTLAIALSLTIITFFNIAQAKPAYTSNQKAFIEAEKAFKQGKSTEYQKLKKSLANYALLPYLEYEEIKKNLNVNSQQAVDDFIEQYESSPLASTLRWDFVRLLAKAKNYDLMAQYYSFGSVTSYDCMLLNHQLKQGKPISALSEQISNLWNVSKSQPKECDSVFEKWIDNNQLQQDVAYQRFYQTAHEGPVGLLSYLKRYLPRDEQYLADLWLKVRRNPKVVTRPNFFPGKNPEKEASLLVYAVKRLAWDDRDDAYSAWKRTQNRIPLAGGHTSDVERTLFLALATENNTKAVDMTKDHLDDYLDDELVNHWKLVTLLRTENWQTITELYELLPFEQQSSEQWRYWYAVSLDNLGKKEEAKILLSDLAGERDYYGYKAATRLKLPILLNHAPLLIPEETMNSVSQSANVERAKELYAIERYLDASREWRSLMSKLESPQEFHAAAVIANQWGWYNQSILTIARAQSWDDTDIRFPTAFKDDYIRMGKQVQLPPHWLMGVARQESAYGPRAVSPAGAYGLMQVMPNTAKAFARKFQIPYTHRSDLLDPAINIQMGSRYLQMRYEELEQNPIYASAAYNAGKKRIEQWKTFGRYPTEIWIEAIPYTETRDYIKRVMTYRQVYALKLGLDDDIFEYILTTETGDKK